MLGKSQVDALFLTQILVIKISQRECEPESTSNSYLTRACAPSEIKVLGGLVVLH